MKKMVETKIWEQYLVVANLLGISNEINKEFKEYMLNKLVPNFNFEMLKKYLTK